MSHLNAITPTGTLVLARLLIAGEKGATAADLKKAIEPLAGHRWSGAELTARLEQTLANLEGAGLAILTKRGKTVRATLSPEGERRALAELGLSAMPPKMTWAKLKKTFLTARALGLPAPQGAAASSFATDNGFKAALLRLEYNLEMPPYPKFDAAIEALSWTLLGFPPGPKFNVKVVQVALIQRALEDTCEFGVKPDPKKEATKLLAKKAGARQSSKVGSSRVDLQACKLEYSIVSPK